MKKVFLAFSFLALSFSLKAQWARIYVTSIECISTEGYVTCDNIYLKVNGSRQSIGRMCEGTYQSLSISYDFKGQTSFEVWDDDMFDPDDHLGTIRADVYDTQVPSVVRTITAGTAKYKITYNVKLL